MILKYQNTYADYQAFYEHRLAAKKVSQRNAYYRQLFWYVAVVVLGGYSGYVANMPFAVCVFLVLGITYIWENWSFNNQWRSLAVSYATQGVESLVELSFDDSGISESMMDCKLSIPWKQVREFACTDEHIFIYFLSNRGFVVPRRDLQESEAVILVGMLKKFNVRERPNQALLPTSMIAKEVEPAASTVNK